MLIKTRPAHGGYQKLYKFENGYGASIVCHAYSYGGDEVLEELAVIKFDKDESWGLCYDTPITDDVIGHLTPGAVEELLKAIEALKGA